MAEPTDKADDGGFFAEREYPKPPGWQVDVEFKVNRISQPRRVPPGVEHA